MSGKMQNASHPPPPPGIAYEWKILLPENHRADCIIFDLSNA